MPKKIDKDIYLERIKKIHNDKGYDYSKFEYKTAREKVSVICPNHGLFQLPAYKLAKGLPCPKCGREIGAKNRTVTTKEFINRAKQIHGDIYDYSQTVYINSDVKVKIICKKHGQFECKPFNHLEGNNCPKCAYENSFDTLESFKEKAQKIHNGYYDYSRTQYVNAQSDIIIICPKHGEFKQKPVSHLQHKGCSKCNRSKGEVEIEIFLIKNGFKYEQQKEFQECINPDTRRLLRFDFYLPDYQLLIEYDGRQHFEKTHIWNNENFEKRQKLDIIKNQWAQQQNIKLFRISYRFRRTIAKQLNKFFKQEYQKETI